MSCVSVLSSCLAEWIRPQCYLKSSVPLRLQHTAHRAARLEAERGRVFQKQPGGRQCRSRPVSWSSASHHVLALGTCQQGCRTDASPCCEQGSLFRTSLEALVIIIKFTEFPIVFAARLLTCWYSVCYKQGQSDPKLTLSQRMSLDLAQVMSLDSFIPGFALEKWGGMRRCSVFEIRFPFQPSVSRPL